MLPQPKHRQETRPGFWWIALDLLSDSSMVYKCGVFLFNQRKVMTTMLEG